MIHKFVRYTKTDHNGAKRKPKGIIEQFNPFFIAIVLVLSVSGLLADQPPDPGGGPGSGDLPVGGGAPLDGAWLFLLIYMVIYSVYKYNRQIFLSINHCDL
jgi:hypothetical protein